jgi:ATP-binding cassette subfamily C (CFTR/MRP) protein 1
MLRGGMIGLIYARSLCLEEGANHDSAAVTLMSTDVETISSAVISAYEIWAQVIEVIIGFSLLTKKLGWVSITPFVIIVLCSRISTRIGTHVGKRRRAWLGAQQKRIGMTSSMLGSMKSLKMMGLANIVEGIIQGQRVLEIELSKKFRWMIVWLNSLGESRDFMKQSVADIWSRKCRADTCADCYFHRLRCPDEMERIGTS